MRFTVGAATDVGRQRSNNEDAYLADEDRSVFAVADGMGGHRAGDVAAAVALESVESRLTGDDTLVAAIQAANLAVYRKSTEDPALRGMGTTFTALRIVEAAAYVAHVGDSRAYLWRDGALARVTDDHSLVEELVREGRLTPEQAAEHPQRAIITRALGVEEELDVDTYEIALRAGDRILLCSDGLTTMVPDPEIETILRSEPDAQRAADALVTAANEAGGEDNITVVVIDVTDDGADRARAEEASVAVADLDAGEPTGEWEEGEHPPASEPAEAAETEREAPTTLGGALRPAPTPEPSAAATRGRARRVAVYAVPVLVVVLVVVGVLTWYARRSYFVGLDGEDVVLYQGVPGGFLIWDPTVEARSELTVDDIASENDEAEVRDGKGPSSRGEAERFIDQLETAQREAERREDERETRRQPTTTTTEPRPTLAGPRAPAAR